MTSKRRIHGVALIAMSVLLLHCTDGGTTGRLDGAVPVQPQDSAVDAASADWAALGDAPTLPPAPRYPPPCLRELFASCPLTGSCRQSPPDGGSQQVCFASGVKQERTGAACGKSELKVARADGSLCYTLEINNSGPTMACERGTYTWKDASGQVVATGGFSCGAGCEEWAQCAGSDTVSECGNYCSTGVTSPPLCETGQCP